MILPGKFEDISKSIVVVGYRIIKLLRKKNYSVFYLYKQINKLCNIDILYFFDILTFLWLLDAIEINFNIISLKNDSQKNLYNA